jgi:probable phosphoglycerate mutase
MLAYALRHAESLANAKLDEGLNGGLTDLGRRQAQAVVNRLGGGRISAIYSSPYLRCIETATPLSRRLNLPIRLRPELCEFHHLAPGEDPDPVLDEVAELARRHPETIPCPDHDQSFTWPPIKEPFENLIKRIQGLAVFLKSRWEGPDEAIILISHGTPVARLIEAWLTDQPGPGYRFVIDNATVSALRYREEVSSLLCLNETSHLQGLPAPQQANYLENGSIKTQPNAGP